jgi:hypothetical protein
MIEKRVPRYDRRLSLGGDYVPKQVKAWKLVKIKKYLNVVFLSIYS